MRPLNAGLSGAGLLFSMIAIFIVLDARGAQTDGPGVALPVPDRGIDELRSEIETLRVRTRLLETELTARAVPAAAVVPEETARAESQEAAGPESAPGRIADLLALGRKVIAAGASPEEAGRFWELARSPGLVDDLLAQTEEEAAASPRDVAARMRLSDAYVVKLFTVPAGPEMGLWGEKAEGQWREVLRLEPSHWQARFNLAVSLSYHPDVEGKTPEAIRELSRPVVEQESRAPESRQADVYRLLAILHRRDGDKEAAEKALRRGLDRHPDDAKIRKALEEGNR